jgi:hypothetical protein
MLRGDFDRAKPEDEVSGWAAVAARVDERADRALEATRA